jgi:hypothetical protein
MSEVKVNKISPRSGTDITLGDSGDTFTIPSGASIVNNGTATGFGVTGAASWTTTVKTSGFTAVAGEGYFVNTTSGAISVNLPAGSAGAVVAFKDYAGTFDSNALTIIPNGSDKIGGTTTVKTLTTEGIAATLIFIDSTQGWLVTDDGLQSRVVSPPYSAEYLVVAGGGAGGSDHGGGGGAGGLLTNFGGSAITLNPGIVYTATVGSGGTGHGGPGSQSTGDPGNNSVLSGSDITTITATGGGGGGQYNGVAGLDGGSGGGGGAGNPGGAGGAGTSPQGNNGGTGGPYSAPNYAGAGGGGAGAVGTDGGTQPDGGAGSSNSITGSAVFYAGGGGGTSDNTPGSGGTGGGGAAGKPGPGTSGTANTGGGGGGCQQPDTTGSGGDGVIILRVPTANYTGTTTGSPTVTTDGTDTIIKFTGSGTYTA